MDFEAKVLRGHVDLEVTKVQPDAQFLTLDSSKTLSISEAQCVASGQKLDIDRGPVDQVMDPQGLIFDSISVRKISHAQFSFSSLENDSELQVFGVCTRIRLPASTKSKIRVVYQTSPDSSALQWMTKEQTAGKRHPYVYSHSEAIHSR